MVAFCGTSVVFPAQIQIFKNIGSIGKSGSKQKKGSINLENAVIESQRKNALTVTKEPHSHDSAVDQHHGVIYVSAMNPVYRSTSQANLTLGTESFKFTVATGRGELHEFYPDTEKERIKWMELLQLLIQYPHSWIPEEPDFDPIKESFQKSLDAKLYNAGKLVSLSPISHPLQSVNNQFNRITSYVNNRTFTD